MPIIQRDPLEDLTHWEPFRGIETLQREMNRLFDRWMPSGNGGIRDLPFIPSAELEESDSDIHLRLEVPGMEAKDLDVEVMEDTVVIKGERKSQSKTEEKGVVHSEFHYGKFERRIPLPAHVQPDQIQAECQHGVLNLTMPKVASEPPKSVKVAIK